jgi:hypothetical protein
MINNIHFEKNNDIVFICITPIRDEDWILSHFLDINSHWADYFIILDQCSIDKSPEIAQKHPKVIYLKNDDPSYNEAYRQKLLFDEARKIKAKKRIIIALDADEYLSSSTSLNEWKQIALLEEGTVLMFPWISILPESNRSWMIQHTAFGYVDNGTEIIGTKIHSTRVPFYPESKLYLCQQLVNIHLQYVPLNRNKKKHQWYQAWELVNNKHHPVDLFRVYNKRYKWPEKELVETNHNWISSMKNFEVSDVDSKSITWWDKDIIDLMEQYGPKYFKKLDIWDNDWNETYRSIGIKSSVKDPRNLFDKIIHLYLRKTQKNKSLLVNRAVDKVIKLTWR